MVRFRRAVAAAAAVGVLVACGDTPSASPSQVPLTPVKLTLNFLAGGPQAGFMYAKKLGYYKDAGLDVTIEEGQGSATTAILVAAGKAEIGFADAASVLPVRAKGGPIKIIAPILQTNAFAIISLKEKNIVQVKDLLGKTLAVQPGTAQTALLIPLLAANGIDQSQLKIVNIDPSALVGTLLQGKVDAILAGADFQGVQISDQGKQINEIFYKDVGIPTVGLSIVASEETITKEPDTLSKFVAASLKGWDAARKNPSAAAQSVADQFPAVGQADQFRKQLEVDIKVLCGPGAKSLGLVPTENWNKTYDLLTKYQGLPTTSPISDYYTNRFLPKDPPKC